MKTLFETLDCTCTTAKAWQLQAYTAQDKWKKLSPEKY